MDNENAIGHHLHIANNEQWHLNRSSWIGSASRLGSP
jgi:hypothetical protein